MKFDAARYLKIYKDIPRYYSDEECEFHYQNFGKAEGRLGFILEQSYTFAIGSYGTKNIGDDAIGTSVSNIYDNVILVNGDHLKIENEFFKNNLSDIVGPSDSVIIGGGGIFTTMQSILYMTDLVDNLISNNIKFQVCRVGFENFHSSLDFDVLIEKFIRFASSFSVRSQYSFDLIFYKYKFNVLLERDFVFELKPFYKEYDKSKKSVEELKIGIVTSHSNDNKIIQLSDFMHKFASHRKDVKFLHIPHSRSTFDAVNNDLLQGEKIWMQYYDQKKYADENYSNLSFTNNLEDIFNIYSDLDLVITERYHGVIFSALCDVPCVIWGVNLKLESFIIDDIYSSLNKIYFVSDQNADDLLSFLKSNFFSKVLK